MIGELIVLAFLLVSVMSCDPVQRHKILTFFFDGVPPLGAEAVWTEGSPVEVVSQSPQSQQVQERPRTVWFMHGPKKDCGLCHKPLEEVRWALPEFVKLLPELCYRCHTDYTVSAAFVFVHGPVAVGECMLCHEVHKSKIAGLLKEKEPELCYQCHETIEPAQIPDHSAEPIPKCTNCHDPHEGLDRMFLKE